MNRSLVANWVLMTMTAASVACGNTNDRGGPPAEEHATTQSRLASRLAAHHAIPTQGGQSPRRRAALARKMAAASPAASSSPAIPAKYQAFAAAFDLDARVGNVPGAAVALIEHGKVTFTYGYGTAAVGTTTPVDANTIFRVGTMTQPLTAAAELALMDQGKGSLEDPIASTVPGVALAGPYAGSLTMRHLLSDQSGLLDFTVWGSDPDLLSNACSTDPATLQSFVTGSVFGQNEVFMSPPGAVSTTFANPNFTLAGAAIEKETGALYTDAMKSVLFAPLGMSRTFFLPSDVAAAGNYATGTIYDPNNNLIAAPDYDCAAYRPFGYAFSSASDYAKFVELLLNGDPKVLSDASRVAMESVQAESRDLGHIAAEGYGLSVNTGYVTQSNAYHPTTTLSSIGQITGFGSIFYAFPETGFGVVILSNLGYAQFGDSIDVAVKSFAGLPRAAPLPNRTYAVPGKFLRYAGTYVDPTGGFGTIIVTDQGGALSLNLPAAGYEGNYWPQLSPVLDDSFLFPLFGWPYVIQFRHDGPGGYQYLVFDDAIVAERVAPDAGP